MCVPGCAEVVHRALSRRSFFGGAAAAGFAATAVTPAQAQRSFTSVIDLTHTLSPEFPTFFGVPGIAIERRYTMARERAIHELVVHGRVAPAAEVPVAASVSAASIDDMLF